MKKYHIVFFLYLLLFSACKKSAETQVGFWNEKNAAFEHPSEGFSYLLPENPSDWVIASSESVPGEMLFFGLDTISRVCVGIFSPDSNNSKIEDISNKNIENIIRVLTMSGPEQTFIQEKLEYSPTRFHDSEAYKFLVTKGLKEDSLNPDTLNIYYSGYIFNGRNRPLGIVVIPRVGIERDSVESVLATYVKGIRISKE